MASGRACRRLRGETSSRQTSVWKASPLWQESGSTLSRSVRGIKERPPAKTHGGHGEWGVPTSRDYAWLCEGLHLNPHWHVGP